MTEKEILEGNKLIVEFMNFHRDEEVVIIDYHSYLYDQLKFHRSWDSLMDIEREIEHMGYRFSLFSCEEHCVVEFTDMVIPGRSVVKIKSYDYNDIIEVVYKAVVEFIKTYKK